MTESKTTLPAKKAASTTSRKDASYSGNMSLSVKLSPEQGLNSYLKEVRKFPMLERDEEFMLAKRWVEHQDSAAAEKMVTSHLRLVAKIAMGYRGYGLPIGEVISEGNVGLMQAVKKFDPDKGFRLSTYAMWWIRAAIQEYVLRSMNRRMGHGGDASLNVTIGGDDGSSEWQDWLQDDTASQEEVLGDDQEHNARMDLLKDAMANLNEREQDIISKRRLADKPMTLEDLAKIYNVSRERIRQIEGRAFEKLQEAMVKAANSTGLIEG